MKKFKDDHNWDTYAKEDYGPGLQRTVIILERI